MREDASFNAALVDFDLPDIDGITLAQQLAHDYPALNLIGFSAHVIDETLNQRTSTLFLGIIQNRFPGMNSVDLLRIICTPTSLSRLHQTMTTNG